MSPSPGVPPAADALPHKTWTRDELALLESTGLFDGTHFELIDGELIDKTGKKKKHIKGTKMSVIALESVFGQEFVLQEAPINVSVADNPRNEPEPDVVVLRRSVLETGEINRPSDIALIVEVADTSLRHDLTTKARLYARAEIPEYWVLDVNGRCLIVLREPSGDEYRVRLQFGEHESVSPVSKPSDAIAVAALLR